MWSGAIPHLARKHASNRVATLPHNFFMTSSGRCRGRPPATARRLDAALQHPPVPFMTLLPQRGCTVDAPFQGFRSGSVSRPLASPERGSAEGKPVGACSVPGLPAILPVSSIPDGAGHPVGLVAERGSDSASQSAPHGQARVQPASE